MYRSVAFGGGGMRGGLHVGTYRALKEQYGSLKFPDGIYGCSVGCLFALATAYDLSVDDLERMYHTYFTLDSFIGKVTLDQVGGFLENKGLMTTERLVETTVRAFQDVGIDLRDKTMDDLPQRVFFLSSNLTTSRPSLLTGKVSVLKAIACSCCLPFIFVPEILNGQVHMDGGVYTRCIREAVSSETLVLHISRTDVRMTPSGTFLDMLMTMTVGGRVTYYGDNIVRIKNSSIRALDEPTEEQRRALAEDGYLQTRAFFAKRLAEEV